ncbi:MAG: SLATT domain-containing protein [Geminicoccaceae bacterium]
MRVLPRAAELLRPVAPGLADIMTSSAVRACAESYPRYSAEAARQQSLLMREATRANLCLLGAGLLSGLVLVAPNAALVLGEPLTQWVILLLGLATLALGALAAMFSYRARESDRLRRWYTARSQAELARLGTFRALAAAATAAGGDTAAAALALVWRHLFEDQRQWLASRAARHRLSYERTNLWGGIASALAFLGGSGAVIASFKPSQSWITVAGVVSAAIAAYALGREGLHRDRANADRYEKSAVALDQLAGRLDEIVSETEAGRPEAMRAFVDEVTSQLEAEHKQWLDGATQAEAALARLDARLQELRERPKAEASPP